MQDTLRKLDSSIAVMVPSNDSKEFSGLFHFIRCMRASHLNPVDLRPIILIVETEPDIKLATFMVRGY